MYGMSKEGRIHDKEEVKGSKVMFFKHLCSRVLAPKPINQPSNPFSPNPLNALSDDSTAANPTVHPSWDDRSHENEQESRRIQTVFLFNLPCRRGQATSSVRLAIQYKSVPIADDPSRTSHNASFDREEVQPCYSDFSVGKLGPQKSSCQPRISGMQWFPWPENNV